MVVWRLISESSWPCMCNTKYLWNNFHKLFENAYHREEIIKGIETYKKRLNKEGIKGDSSWVWILWKLCLFMFHYNCQLFVQFLWDSYYFIRKNIGPNLVTFFKIYFFSNLFSIATLMEYTLLETIFNYILHQFWLKSTLFYFIFLPKSNTN